MVHIIIPVVVAQGAYMRGCMAQFVESFLNMEEQMAQFPVYVFPGQMLERNI